MACTHNIIDQHATHVQYMYLCDVTLKSECESDFVPFSSVKDKDDLDFDEFLESVKARQQSMTTGEPLASFSE